MIGSIRSQARLTVLLTRHLLHVVKRQRARAFVLWAALTLALGIGVGLLAFVTSIEDSFRERGRAVGGVSDIQVEAIGPSSLQAGLAGRLEKIEGTRYAIPMAQQRVVLEAGPERIVATAIGVDRSARRLRSAVQSDLRVPTGGSNKPGLALPTALAGELRVRRGERVRIFAFEQAPRVRVARVVDVDPAIEDVITLPRDRLESLRGAPGQPTVVYVKLAPGTSTEAWERRAERVLPDNAVLTTPDVNQGELSHVLDFTVRAPTFVFGMVVLAIAGLLIYVLQLMRMLERQEDLGLLRALGSRRLPLILAESIVLAGLLAAAIAPGVLIGTPIAHYLASQVPTYLTDVFGFNMQVVVRPDVVAVAAVVALVVGIAATVGALASARGSIAEQLGRSPQAGATVTSTISLRSALALLAGGAACLALGLVARRRRPLSPRRGDDPGRPRPRHAGCRRPGRDRPRPSRARRLEGCPCRPRGRRGQPPPGGAGGRDHGAGRRRGRPAAARRAEPDRADRADQQVDPPQRPAAAGRRRRLRQRSDHDPLRPAGAARRVDRRPADGVRLHPLPRGERSRCGPSCRARAAASSARGRPGCPGELPILREHPDDILISRVMAAGLDLDSGEKIELPTAVGPRKLRIRGTVEDFAWPSGTVYMNIQRYRELYRTAAVNVLAVDRRGRLDSGGLKDLKPLHAVTGVEFSDGIEEQMNQSTKGLFAMRILTLIAALVAVGGIIATSVFARRREWAVLRAMGIGNGDLLAALALETLLVMSLGAFCGAIGGIVSFRGPTLGFLEAQGYVIGNDLALGTVAAVTTAAVLIGALAAALPAWLTARAPLADALSYE